MMTYALVFYERPEEFEARDSDAENYWAAWTAYIGEIEQAGALVSGAGLMPPHAATAVRIRDGAATIHDGPFTDTKEQIGGFLRITVANLDEALAWAKKAPCASTGGVEVRPVLEMG